MSIATKTEFARMNGWSPSYITKLGHDGRLVLDGAGKVVVEESLALIKQTEGGRTDVKQRHAAERAPGADKPPTAAQDNIDRVAGTYQTARALNEKYKAMQAKLDYDRTLGNVIPKEEVEAAFKFIGAAVFAIFDTFPGQNAPILAAISGVDDTEAARNATSGPAASGQCLNPRCGEDLAPGRRWCDADCRDAWQRMQKSKGSK